MVIEVSDQFEKPTFTPWSHRPTVGFIGLGIMGEPMARHLMAAGYDVTVYNRSQAAVNRLVGEGARRAETPAALAQRSDCIVTMVTDSPDVEQVVLGNGGVIEGVRPGSVVVDMSTISPKVTRRVAQALAEKGVAMLDAPVSGGDKGARDGTLSIMVGGDPVVFEACRPLFETMGRTIVHVGDNGMGQTVKLVNQVVVGLNLLAVAEGLSLAVDAGADPHEVLNVISQGAAASWALDYLGPKMVDGDHAPGFMVKLQQKDLKLALDAADELHLSLPGTALVHQLLTYVERIGGGDWGTQTIMKTYEALRPPLSDDA